MSMRVKLLLTLIIVSLAISAQNCGMAQDAAEKQALGSYIFEPGDVILIQNGHDSQSVSVLPDGTATTHYGVIQAAGMTVQGLTALVNDVAKRWYVSPDVKITLAKQRPSQFYLLGEVVHPGLYSLAEDSGTPGTADSKPGGNAAGASKGPSSLSGEVFLSGALQMAGGVKDTADVRHVRVTRSMPKQVFNIDLWQCMFDGNTSQDLALKPGDVVYVPKGRTNTTDSNVGQLVNTTKVRVVGAVKSPGLIAISSKDDVLSIIGKAGGFELDAITNYVLLCRRTNSDGTVTTDKIDIKVGTKDEQKKVLSGDLIIVKRSSRLPVGDFDPDRSFRN
jgi:polysaccharide biosynthesis/export protein